MNGLLPNSTSLPLAMGFRSSMGPAHTRGAGTFARILGQYVRKRKALSLMDALRKMTLLPAQPLEAVASQMKKKGRGHNRWEKP